MKVNKETYSILSYPQFGIYNENKENINLWSIENCEIPTEQKARRYLYEYTKFDLSDRFRIAKVTTEFLD